MFSIEKQNFKLFFIFSKTKAPTAPVNLTCTNVSENSIDLVWNRPIDVNGPFMTYQLWFNEQKLNINNNYTMNETFSFTLKSDLKPFTNYIITVLACNSECSPPCESLTITTKMGKPQKMLQPKIERTHGSVINVSWTKPIYSAENFTFYQMIVNSMGFRISGHLTSCIIDLSVCEEKLDVSIRAINSEIIQLTADDSENCLLFPDKLDKITNETLIGEWSPSMAYYCNVAAYTLIAVPLLALLMVIITIYTMIKMYKKYQNMKDIDIVWPEGFDPDVWHTPTQRNVHKYAENSKIHEYQTVMEEDDVMVVKRDASCDENVDLCNEVLHPFIVNPVTNEVSYSMPKVYSLSSGSKQKDVKSLRQIEDKGYMKMSEPKIISPKLSPIHEGYLDMNGNSPIRKPETDYQEIKTFLRNSIDCNDGYIGKRSTTFSEFVEKPQAFEKRTSFIETFNVTNYDDVLH